MSDDELYGLLKDYYAIRDSLKALEAHKKDVHRQLMESAVERGMPQQDSVQGGVKEWLDGYLFGRGFYRGETHAKRVAQVA